LNLHEQLPQERTFWLPELEMSNFSAGPAVDTPPTAEPTGCPLTAALTAIGGKWSMICLYWLDSSARRFNDLQRLMPGISHKVLTETLRNLEREGLVTRTECFAKPPRVEYQISTYGETVRPLIEAVRRWGRAHIERPHL
jgi:DNA-binding HxlR family transcriptional regulator